MTCASFDRIAADLTGWHLYHRLFITKAEGTKGLLLGSTLSLKFGFSANFSAGDHENLDHEKVIADVR